MADTVVAFPGASQHLLGEPRAELIGVLENMLERAKSGQLQSFIGVGYTSDGCRCLAWVDLHEDVYQMLGALAWLQHEYVHKHTDGS